MFSRGGRVTTRQVYFFFNSNGELVRKLADRDDRVYSLEELKRMGFVSLYIKLENGTEIPAENY